MTQTEALRLALGALGRLIHLAEHEGWERLDKEYEAITAIKAVLANEALERKAENARELGLDYEPVQWKMGASGIGGTGVIVQPQRTWVALTDDEVWEWFRDNTALTNETGKRIYQAIEAQLRSKNENTRG